MPLNETRTNAKGPGSTGCHSNTFNSTTSTRKSSMFWSVRDRMLHQTNMVLPSFPIDKTYLSTQGRYAGSYVKHQKTYLKLKGFDVNDMYSVNRHQRGKLGECEHQREKRCSSLSETDLPPLTLRQGWTRKPSTSSHSSGSSVWRPRDSTKPRGMVVRLHPTNLPRISVSQSTDRVLYNSGYQIKSNDYNKNQRLGKVLTRTHLRALLSQDEPVIQKTFCLETNT